MDTEKEPITTFSQYSTELLNHLKKKATEGEETLKRERVYNEAQKCMDYIGGEQVSPRSKSISHITNNRIRKIVLETVSSLTDVRPIWNYETNNENFKQQADILNKLARNWWRSCKIDRKLQSILTYACAAGTGYGAFVWNEEAPGGGDFDLIPYDPRDVIPIAPVYSDSIQDWRGVICRQQLPIEEVRKLFPSKAYMLGDRGGTSWFTNTSRASGKMMDVISTAWGILSGSDKTSKNRPVGTTDLIRVFLKDDSLNTGLEPVMMGRGNWGYTVYPVGSIHPERGEAGEKVSVREARLYPRGRIVVCTPDAILSDEPNHYWHGLFPVIKFTLDPLPWTILGSSMVLDILPLQDALNEALRGMEDGIGQWVRRGVKADRNAISKAELDKIDSRRSGLKQLVNPSAGLGFELLDGPTLPAWYLKAVELFISQMDDNSGVRGLQQLAQLKQMPAADTVEQFMEALSPILRMRGRSLEVSLGELAEMLKVGFFQYYTADRRVQVLGERGQVVEDFDYNPGQMVPDDSTPEKHHRNFTFSIAPNSFLNVSHSTQKMLLLQLFRVQGIDIYSLWEGLDVPNIGKIPAETIPERMIAARKLGLQAGPTPEMVQMQEALAIAQAQAGIQQVEQAMALGQPGLPGGQPPSNPVGGPSNNGVGPQGGRPPSGQELPQMVQKSGGRTVVSESGR